MPSDLRELLHDTAVQPRRPVDTDAVIDRALRRRRAVRAATGVTLLAVTVLAVAVIRLPSAGPVPPEVLDTPTGGSTAPASPDASLTTAPTDPNAPVIAASSYDDEAPSQSPEDAQRDGVLAEVAALPMAARVSVGVARWTPEGIWVGSRLPSGCSTSPCADVEVLGDPDGVYGRDYIATRTYGELLLLSHLSLRIVRAYPLPDLRPDALEVTPYAVFCAHQGDGALPNSMLCRVDRTTEVAKVSVFTFDGSESARPPEYLPPNWRVQSPADDVWFERLVYAHGALWVGHDHADTLAWVNPATLDLVTVTQRPSDRLVRFATDHTSAYVARGERLIEVDGSLTPTGYSIPNPASFPDEEYATPLGTLQYLVEGATLGAVWSDGGDRLALLDATGTWVESHVGDIAAVSAMPRGNLVVVSQSGEVYRLGADDPDATPRHEATLARFPQRSTSATSIAVGDDEVVVMTADRWWRFPSRIEQPGSASTSCADDVELRRAAPPDDPSVVAVYFSCEPLQSGGGVYQHLVELDAPLPDVEDRLAAALDAYIRGPSPELRDRGYYATVSEERDYEPLVVEVEGSDATISFGPAIEAIGSESNITHGLMNELTALAFQFDEIDAVEFQVDGDCQRFAVLHEGTCGVHTRAEYEAQKLQNQ